MYLIIYAYSTHCSTHQPTHVGWFYETARETAISRPGGGEGGTLAHTYGKRRKKLGGEERLLRNISRAVSAIIVTAGVAWTLSGPGPAAALWIRLSPPFVFDRDAILRTFFSSSDGQHVNELVVAACYFTPLIKFGASLKSLGGYASGAGSGYAIHTGARLAR